MGEPEVQMVEEQPVVTEQVADPAESTAAQVDVAEAPAAEDGAAPVDEDKPMGDGQEGVDVPMAGGEESVPAEGAAATDAPASEVPVTDVPVAEEPAAVGGDEPGQDSAPAAEGGGEEEGKEQTIELEGKPEDAIPEDEGEGEGTEGEKVEAETDAEAKANGKDPTDPTSRPPHGSEVFIGGITRDTTEEDLKELCSKVGEIYEVRILKDKETGNNKGYGFVTFTNKENAEKAIATLSDSEVKGKKVRVSHSQPKHRLFIGNVPKTWEKEDLDKALAAEGPGVTTIELLKDPKIPGRNRGFAFVEYYNHACAEQARRNLSKPHFRLGNNVPTISWADPRPEPDAAAMATVKVVYVKGLPDGTTEEQLQELFTRHGEVTRVMLPAPKPGQGKRDFGFVHFAERSQALKAIDKDEKYEIDGKKLEVSLAKPPMEKRPPHQEPYPPQRGGLLPQYQQRGGGGAGGGYGAYGGGGGYGGGGYGGGQSRGGYERSGPAQAPVIYGRGPAPAGMTMVPMMLPDGRVGYVFQPGGSGSGGGGSGGAGYRDGGRGGSRAAGGPAAYGASATQGRRYRPY